MVKTFSTVAVAKGATVSASTLTLSKGALNIMAWTKAKTAVIAGVCVLLAAGTATVGIKEIQEHRTYPWQAGGREGWFSGQLLNQQPPQIRILASSFTNFAEGTAGDKEMGTGIPAQGVVAAAYGSTSARTIASAILPRGRYDFIASLTQGNAQALQREVQKKWGVTGRVETRDTEVLVLRVKNPAAPGLKRTAHLNDAYMMEIHPDELRCQNQALRDVCEELEVLANRPVIDQTGLTGHFDFDLHVDWGWTPGCNAPNPDLTQPFINLNNVREALLSQLGLELVPTNLPVEMLVVGRAKS
jgi:uncharacterized protein (TIGR03435 family)